jgi:hypothetical protein
MPRVHLVNLSRRLFLGKPMPDLACPGEQLEPAINQG